MSKHPAYIHAKVPEAVIQELVDKILAIYREIDLFTQPEEFGKAFEKLRREEKYTQQEIDAANHELRRRLKAQQT
ncbi:MAG: hypothetical protein GF390_01240 [Candidatus Pacebacteria bacterium]|nr:hypothetical protein [Candidatus Paceibacterota bacterium]